MPKISAFFSPANQHQRTNKRKLESALATASSPLATTTGPALQSMNVIDDKAPQSELPTAQNTELGAFGDAHKNSKRKAGEGFQPWKPKPACIEIPKVQPHWGIIPRPGGHRPSEPQPPALTSDGAIRPALWEDRKGAIRLKRGSRIIDGYDQAYHMWLPLMDVRPISNKNQTPRRVPVGYHYPHGMPLDWNDTGALNDLNKALQEAIKAKSNKEAPFTAAERKVLAGIFAVNPEISMWDAAQQFNHQAHPIMGDEKGQYPSGRFTESIVHEFRTYKSSYIKGQAPTDMTEKDIPLEKLYARAKALRSESEVATMTSSKKPSCKKMSDISGMVKKNRTPKKQRRSSAELEASADTTYQKISDEEAEDKQMFGLGGAYTTQDVQPLSPLSALTHAVVASSSPGMQGVVESEKQVQVSQAPNNCIKAVLGNPSVATQPIPDAVAKISSASHVESDLIKFRAFNWREMTIQNSQTDAAAGTGGIVAGAQIMASTKVSTFVEKAARDVEIDEDYYDEDDELGYE